MNENGRFSTLNSICYTLSSIGSMQLPPSKMALDMVTYSKQTVIISATKIVGYKFILTTKILHFARFFFKNITFVG